MMASSPPPPVEDQARLLEDALTVVRQQSIQMRRCLETPGKLMDALKCRYGWLWIKWMRNASVWNGISLTVPQLNACIRAAHQ